MEELKTNRFEPLVRQLIEAYLIPPPKREKGEPKKMTEVERMAKDLGRKIREVEAKYGKGATETTEARKKALLAGVLACNGFITYACNYVGVGVSTSYEYREDEEWMEAFIQLKEDFLVDVFEKRVADISANARFPGVQLTATLAWLNAKARSRGWGTQGELKIESKGPVKVEFSLDAIGSNSTS